MNCENYKACYTNQLKSYIRLEFKLKLYACKLILVKVVCICKYCFSMNHLLLLPPPHYKHYYSQRLDKISIKHSDDKTIF